MVESPSSKRNITDLADLMKVSEKLPSVPIRRHHDTSELIAVFTKPTASSRLALNDLSFVKADADALDIA
jgi:hypothetical protein